MTDYEGQLLTELMSRLANYISPEDTYPVRNVIVACLYNYDISAKKSEIVVYDNFNEKVLRQFIATKRIEGKSPRTIERYEDFIRKLIDFYPNLTFREISTSNLRFFMAVYQETRHNSNRSMDGIRRIFTAFFNWLSDEEFIESNPAKRLSKIKHDTRKEEPFTEWDMEALMLASRSIKDKAMMEFMYSTACRISEMCSVDINHVDFVNKRVLLHGKGNKDRIVPLTDKALFYINEYLKVRGTWGSEALFVTTHSPHTRITPNSVRRKLSTLAKRAGVKHVHPHRYRVTRITTLLKRGMKLEEVQVIAGHTAIGTTAMYNRSDMTLVESEFRRRG